ncbi:MAG: universal stress protein [Actinomycetota bacterium]
MSTTQIFLLIAVVWVAIGSIVTFVMGRRGHDLFNWGVLGAVFGPLVIFLALDAARHEPEATAPRQVRVGTPGPGPVQVLVGIDGSAESTAAMSHAIDLLGDRIGQLTLAAVIDHDAARTARPWGAAADAERALETCAASVVAWDPETVVLAGAPGAALLQHATDKDYDLLVVGSRGHGASKAVLGSVASRLVRAPGLPVLIAGS